MCFCFEGCLKPFDCCDQNNFCGQQNSGYNAGANLYRVNGLYGYSCNNGCDNFCGQENSGYDAGANLYAVNGLYGYSCNQGKDCGCEKRRKCCAYIEFFCR